MRRWFLLLALTVSVPVISLPPIPVEAQASLWKRFTSAKSGFSAVMPGTPKQRKEKNLTVYEVTRDEEKMRYSVGVIDLAIAPGDDPKLTNEVFEGIRKGAEKQDGKLLSFKTIKLAGQYPGREMNFTLPDEFRARWRVYVVGKRAYFLSVTTTQENLETKLAGSTAVFLNSLRVQAPKPQSAGKR